LTARPVPVADELSAPYWDATARHELHMARCQACDRFAMPPSSVCPNCFSTEPRFAFERVSGRGRLRSWTTVNQSFLPGFEDLVPFLLVDVELLEQDELRMTGRLLDGPDAGLRLGAAVQIAFEDIAPGVSVPAFRLEQTS
jgi:uncharacterized OB-fold protein